MRGIAFMSTGLQLLVRLTAMWGCHALPMPMKVAPAQGALGGKYCLNALWALG